MIYGYRCQVSKYVGLQYCRMLSENLKVEKRTAGVLLTVYTNLFILYRYMEDLKKHAMVKTRRLEE
jgi:hypothetical protein